MKNFLRTLLLVFTVFTFIIPLRAQWIPTGLTNTMIKSMAVSGTDIFAGTGGDGVFLSTNSGTSWTAVNTGLTDSIVNTLAVSHDSLGNTNIFAGTYYDGIFLSTNNGTSWTAVNTGLTNHGVSAIISSGTNLFAGTYGGGVFLSTNNGANWTAVNSGLTSMHIMSFAISGSNIFVGLGQDGVFISTDNGTNWTAANTGLPSSNSNVLSLVVSGTNLFAGTMNDGVFLSTNNGTSWTSAGLDFTVIWSLTISGSNIFAGTGGSGYSGADGVYLSTDNGTNWTQVNTGLLTDPWVSCLAIEGTDLFAGTYDDGVWRRPLSELITAVKEDKDNLPFKFSLKQNYPNPFNPSTKIKFSVPEVGLVTLKVYDVLGNELATLVNEEKPIGSYEVNFNAGNLSSGIYFYRLQVYPANGGAGSFVETKKMVLLH